MSGEYQRASAYMDQDRYNEAITELTKLLSAEPDNARARGKMALCLHHLKRSGEGSKEAKRAISLAPEDPYLHYILAYISFETRQSKVAEAESREAIRIDPYNAAYYGVLALTLGQLARWQESLKIAEAGLEMNPSEANCLNARTQALSFLGRKKEAYDSVREAMQENSEEALTHAHAGWAMLRQGRVKEAIDHFREGLRLDPNNDYCRQGMVEALRARFPIYCVVLSFRTWLGRLPPGLRRVVLIGLYVIGRGSAAFSDASPELRWVLVPIAVAYAILLIFLWLGGPVLNVTLLAHPLGRIALTRYERREAAALGTLILSGLLAFAVGGLAHNETAITGGLLCALGVIIVALLNRVTPGRGRTAFVCIFGYGFAALGVVLTAWGLLSPPTGPGY